MVRPAVRAVTDACSVWSDLSRVVFDLLYEQFTTALIWRTYILKCKDPKYYRETHVITGPLWVVLGDDGEEEHSFNRKRPPVEHEGGSAFCNNGTCTAALNLVQRSCTCSSFQPLNSPVFNLAANPNRPRHSLLTAGHHVCCLRHTRLGSFSI